MSGKRGSGLSWMGENIGEIVLAILGLILLTSLLFIMVGAPFKKQARLQAAGTLEDIYKYLAILGEDSVQNYSLQAPLGWGLKSFGENSGFDKVKKCIKKNCVCVCEGAGFSGYKCQDEELCEITKKPILSGGKDVEIRITTLKRIDIKNLKDNYEINEVKE